MGPLSRDLFASSLDITERRQAEEERQANRLMSYIIEHSPLASPYSIETCVTCMPAPIQGIQRC